MAWATALTDLRVKLSDSATDKLRAFKRVFGDVDGSNKRFKTFEFRRVTDFSTAVSPLGVYVNGSLISSASIATDDTASGFFTFVTAPSASDVIEASYYVQFFLDSELQSFLRLSTQWLGLGDDYNNITLGLQPAALQYAASEAYQKLAARFSEHLSETYRLEDMPDVQRQALISEYKNAAAQAREQAHGLRDEYYKRQGQPLAPLFAVNRGFVRNVVPNR